MCYNFLVWTSIHCNMSMHGSTFDIVHHAKVPKAILC
jgi:hypothetical protein